MRRPNPYAIALLVSLVWSCGCLAAEPRNPERGSRVYEREGCAMCHSIQGKGNRRNPLDGAGGRLSPEEIRKWIVSPQEMKPGVKKKAYSLSEQDIDALVEYIDSLAQ